jgi:hypothetical protein
MVSLIDWLHFDESPPRANAAGCRVTVFVGRGPQKSLYVGTDITARYPGRTNLAAVHDILH